MNSSQAANKPSDEFRAIPLDQLEIGEWNVRHRDITIDLDELAYSMNQFGLQQPIVVQAKNDKFEILIGQRRYLAAKKLGWSYIDAKVRHQKLDEFEAKVISFSENVQRKDLSPRDKSDTCTYLLNKLGTTKKVAQHLGITETTVRKWLGYAGVPEKLKVIVDEKKITPQTAMRLAQYVEDENKAAVIAEKISEIRPPKDQRDRIFASVEENPGSSVERIFEIADEKKKQTKITFILPPMWSSAITRASKQLDMHPNDIARDATIEWLQMLRY